MNGRPPIAQDINENKPLVLFCLTHTPAKIVYIESGVDELNQTKLPCLPGRRLLIFRRIYTSRQGIACWPYMLLLTWLYSCRSGYWYRQLHEFTKVDQSGIGCCVSTHKKFGELSGTGINGWIKLWVEGRVIMIRLGVASRGYRNPQMILGQRSETECREGVENVHRW